MSGVPNTPQIIELRDALEEICAERDAMDDAVRVRDLQNQIIENAAARILRLEEKAIALMEAMDCGPNGNYGSRNRMLALMTGMVTDDKRNARSTP